MDAELTPAERQRRDAVRERLDAWGDRDRVREVLTSPEGHDGGLLADLAATGWFDASRRTGGPTVTELALALAEVGRLPVPAPVQAVLVQPTALLAALGRADQAEAAGRLAPSTAYCDGGSVVARPLATGWALDGRVPLAPFGGEAGCLLVPTAIADRDGTGAVFLVPAGARGVERTVHPVLGSGPAATVCFDGVRLSADDLVAELPGADPGGGRTALAAALDVAVVGQAAELWGAADAALAVAVAYVTERHQWGRPIGSLQAVQHRAADMHIDVVAARCAVLDAAGRADLGLPFAAAASTAKVVATEAALRVTAGAHQLHGGEGYYADRDPGLFHGRVRSLAPRLGDVRAHLRRLDRLRTGVS